MLTLKTMFRPTTSWLLVFSFVLVAAGTDDAGEGKHQPAHMPPDHGLIRPGEGIDGVALGSDFSSFEAIFPKQPKFDEDYTQCDDGRVYHWLDLNRDATGVYVYLKHDQIYQISVQTPRFALSNGIKIDSPETQVRKTYPYGRGYILLGSGSVAVGGRDLTYWVDQRQGVAFEFYWYQEQKQRFIRAIDVFQRGADFSPEGCISPPQQWRALTAQQLAFSAEDNGVEHPVPVPSDVLAILRKDEGVKSVLESENILPKNLPSSWFSVSIVHLSAAKRNDLVVVGQPPVSGANVTSFWVFRATAHGHELVLYAPAHDLIIKNTRWKGYRDIEFAGMTAAEITTVLCHFDGRRYRAYRTKAEPIQ